MTLKSIYFDPNTSNEKFVQITLTEWIVCKMVRGKSVFLKAMLHFVQFIFQTNDGP